MSIIVQKFRENIGGLASERGVTLDRAFPAWCMAFVHEIDSDEALAKSDTLAGWGGGDGGLDGWWRDEENNDFHLWQCKWSATEDRTYDRAPALELLDALTALLDAEAASKRGPAFVDIAARLRRAADTEYQIVLNLGLAGSVSEKVREQITKAASALAENIEPSMRLDIWDWEALSSEYEQRHPTNQTLEGIKVKFYLQSPTAMEIGGQDKTLPDPWRAVVASLNAKSLGEAASEHGPRLFSLNVRYSLGMNRRIRNLHECLRSPDDSPYFWLYNNGVTIVCDDFDLQAEANPPYVLVTNPQVVNGCQTITAFRRRLGEYSDKPSVLARIIKPPLDVDSDRDTTLKIAERTNSQNEVRSRDLKSNNPVQRKLAIAFDELNKPWFYERKRGEWNGITSSRKRRFLSSKPEQTIGLRYRRIDMEAAGQTFRMLFAPAESITKKRDMFEDDETYSWVYRSDRSPSHYLCAFLLHRRFSELWHHKNFAQLQAMVGSHAKDEVFRRLLRAKGQVVAHSLALTRLLVQEIASEPGDITVRDWTVQDAKNGILFANHYHAAGRRWTLLLWKGFRELLSSTDSEDQYLTFKKLLERGDGIALEELWESVSEAASFLIGPNWRVELRKQIICESIGDGVPDAI